MKNKWNLLWNPFIRIAGWQAFIAGLVIAIITGIIATYGNLFFDGVLDAHFGENIIIAKSFLLLAIDLASVILVMYVVGLILTKNFRFIDIVGTMTLSRAPLIVLAIFSLFVSHPDTSEILQNPMTVLSYPLFIIFGLISLPIIIWYIALMYNGLKTSVGVKGSKMIVGFIIGILVAEIVSKLLIHLFL